MLVWVPSVTKFDLFWTYVSLNWTCSPDLLCLSSDSESNYTNIVVFMMPSAPTSFKCGVCNPYWGLLRHRCYIMSWCLLCFMQSTLNCLVVKTCYTSEPVSSCPFSMRLLAPSTLEIQSLLKHTVITHHKKNPSDNSWTTVKYNEIYLLIYSLITILWIPWKKGLKLTDFFFYTLPQVQDK